MASCALWPGLASADAACINCHSLLRPPWRRAPALNLLHDAHRAEDISCIDCHGGEDRPSVQAHAVRSGFRANPVGTCVGCHMGPEERAWWEAQPRGSDPDGGVAGGSDAGADGGVGVGVSADADAGANADAGLGAVPEVLEPAEAQITSHYLTSAHAASHLADGRGATCGDCHRAHRASSPDDPASSVHWTSIPATCGRCHHDATVVGEELEDPVSRWGRSVHGRTWAIRSPDPQDPQDPDNEDVRHGPGCADCHDPHGNTSGEEAVEACGTCHGEIRDAFDQGPHVEAFARRGFLDCVECHGSHEILSSDSSLITAGRESACRRCHGPEQEAYEQIGVLGAALEGADAARRRIAHADEALRGEAAQVTADLVAAVHRLAVEEVEAHAATLAELAGEAPELPDDAADSEAGLAADQDGDSRAGWVRPVSLVAVALLIALAFTSVWRRRRVGR